MLLKEFLKEHRKVQELGKGNGSSHGAAQSSGSANSKGERATGNQQTRAARLTAWRLLFRLTSTEIVPPAVAASLHRTVTCRALWLPSLSLQRDAKFREGMGNNL